MSDYIPQHSTSSDSDGDALPQPSKFVINSGVYDNLKRVAQIWLPALAVFYITIAPFWGLPKQEEVAGTIMALDLLLGALLTAVSHQYNNSDARFDGEVIVSQRDAVSSDVRFKMDDTTPLLDKDEIVVKVNRV